MGCGVQFAWYGLQGAGCEMLNLILELQTYQLGLCFGHAGHDSLTEKRCVALYFAN